MADEDMCYAVGCTNHGALRCSRCHYVHYCSKECQAKDWKRNGHKKKCELYQKVYKLREASSSDGDNNDDGGGDQQQQESKKEKIPDGILTIVELREGNYPWHYILDHSKTRRLVVKGMLDLGYIFLENNGQGPRRLTMELYDNELTEIQRKEIVLSYILHYTMDVVRNGQFSIMDQSINAKMPKDCHVCGKIDATIKNPLHEGDYMPDVNVGGTRLLCNECYTKQQVEQESGAQKAFDVETTEWKLVDAGEWPADTPDWWKTILSM